MGHAVELIAADGHALSAWVAEPPEHPLGGLLVIQEIFGLNAHMKSVCESLAEAGFLAIAPAPFDRIERDITVDYDDIDRGRQLIGRLDQRKSLLDFAAGVEYAMRSGKVGVVGFCWGGGQAYRCAAALPIAAAVCYYGGGIHALNDITPQCPLMFHYGAEDPYIPREQVAAVAEAHPEAQLYIYEGVSHGFNCDQREDYDADASRLAYERTCGFLKGNLSG